MKELDLKEKSSKSLLANVLDMDDDFVPSSSLPHSHVHPHPHQQTQQKNGGFIRYSTCIELCILSLCPEYNNVRTQLSPARHKTL